MTSSPPTDRPSDAGPSGDPASGDPASGDPASGDRPSGGLRQRKKARTRAAIQRHALRLFVDQGYAATTVEQIAAAAEVSPSTFFRYFPTKEDVVLTDDYDPLIIRAFRAQPSDATPLRALRNAMRAALGELAPEELAGLRERVVLMTSVLELRAALLAGMTDTTGMIAELVASQAGRTVDDPAVRISVGALMGAWLTVILYWAAHPGRDLADDMDEAMAHLEAGLPL
jgi:AcrR family transcriptional regulator